MKTVIVTESGDWLGTSAMMKKLIKEKVGKWALFPLFFEVLHSPFLECFNVRLILWRNFIDHS